MFPMCLCANTHGKFRFLNHYSHSGSQNKTILTYQVLHVHVLGLWEGQSHSDTRGRTPHKKDAPPPPNPAGWGCDLLAVRWQCSYRMWQLLLYRLAAVEASTLISEQQPLFTMVSSFPWMVFLLSFLKKNKISLEPSLLAPALPATLLVKEADYFLKSPEILKTPLNDGILHTTTTFTSLWITIRLYSGAHKPVYVALLNSLDEETRIAATTAVSVHSKSFKRRPTLT